MQRWPLYGYGCPTTLAFGPARRERQPRGILRRGFHADLRMLYQIMDALATTVAVLLAGRKQYIMNHSGGIRRMGPFLGLGGRRGKSRGSRTKVAERLGPVEGLGAEAIPDQRYASQVAPAILPSLWSGGEYIRSLLGFVIPEKDGSFSLSYLRRKKFQGFPLLRRRPAERILPGGVSRDIGGSRPAQQTS